MAKRAQRARRVALLCVLGLLLAVALTAVPTVFCQDDDDEDSSVTMEQVISDVTDEVDEDAGEIDEQVDAGGGGGGGNSDNDDSGNAQDSSVLVLGPGSSDSDNDVDMMVLEGLLQSNTVDDDDAEGEVVNVEFEADDVDDSSSGDGVVIIENTAEDDNDEDDDDEFEFDISEPDTTEEDGDDGASSENNVELDSEEGEAEVVIGGFAIVGEPVGADPIEDVEDLLSMCHLLDGQVPDDELRNELMSVCPNPGVRYTYYYSTITTGGGGGWGWYFPSPYAPDSATGAVGSRLASSTAYAALRAGRGTPVQGQVAAGGAENMDVCAPCPEGHQVRIRARMDPNDPAAVECGECMDAISVRMRMTDQNIETFDLVGFQTECANILGINPRRLVVKNVEEGSVIVTFVILPTYSGVDKPMNMTGGNSTEGVPDSINVPGGVGGPGAPVASEDSAAGATGALSFRSGEVGPVNPQDSNQAYPTAAPIMEFSSDELRKLDYLLASHFLPNFGPFSYDVVTGEEHCGRFVYTEDEVRTMIMNEACKNTTEPCSVVWGTEVPALTSPSEDSLNQVRQVVSLTRGFEGGVAAVTDLIYESIFGLVDNDTIVASALQFSTRDTFAGSVSQALNEVGNDVLLEVDNGVDLMIQGGMANLSVANCTGCLCSSSAELNQPFVEWNVLPLA